MAINIHYSGNLNVYRIAVTFLAVRFDTPVTLTLFLLPCFLRVPEKFEIEKIDWRLTMDYKACN